MFVFKQSDRLTGYCLHCVSLVVLLLVFLTLFSVPVFAQPLRNAEPGEDRHALFPTSRLYSKNYRDAIQLIGEKKYSAGIPELQSILDAPEDYVSPEQGLDFSSLKSMALQVIADLPAEGKRFYSLQYGPAAEQLLNQAVEQDDLNQLQEVVRRYFFTKAGAEAAYTLGAYYFERGDFWAATRQWEALSDRHDLGQSKEPHLTFKLAVAWYYLGNQGKCRQTLKKLVRLTSGKPFELPNGTKITLTFANDNPVDWFAALLGTPDLRAAEEQKDWTMYRGSPSRLASALFAVPSAKPVWRFSTIQDSVLSSQKDAPPLENMLQKLGEYRRKHVPGVLPAASPLIIQDQVIFRTHRNLKAVSLSKGELTWQTTLPDALYQKLLQDPQNEDEESLGMPETPLEKYLTQRAWQDYTAGHLSTDGKLVFSVENVGFIAGFYHFSRLDRDNILVPNSYNRLMAFEADSGKFVWEAGGPRLQNPMNYSGHYFLGAPLPLDGKLYCLAEEGREFRLLVLDPQTGKTLWTQSLYRSKYPIARDFTTDRRPMDHIRRRMGLSPSFAHGVLVCETGEGCTVGIDIVNRRILWRKVDVGGEAITMYAAFARDTNKNEEGWAEFTPLIVGNRVLIYSRKLQNLQCLDLFDGRLLWSKARRKKLFVADVQGDKILLVSNDRIEAIKLSDGDSAWPKSQPIPAPSGRGIVVKNTYFQPVDTGEILSIRLDDGLILARTRVEMDSLVGNLAAAGGMLVSQNESEVVGFRSVESIRQQIRLADQSNQPADLALAQLLRGELNLFAGDVNLAMQKIDQSIQIQPTIRARRLYADMLLESLDHDFNQNLNQISKTESLLVDDDQRKRFYQILALNYQQQGNLQAALQNYLRLSELRGLLELETIKGGSFVRTDRWIRSQLEILLARASEQQRAEIDEFFSLYFAEKLLNAKRDVLERFLLCCGNLPETEQARVLLIERLEQEAINAGSLNEQAALRRHLMQHLEHLRESKNPEMAAFATARLAQIYLGTRHAAQADALLDELVSRWPNVVCLDQKTSLQLAAEWRSESSFQKQQSTKSEWPDYPAQVYRGEHPRGQNTSLPVEIIGLSNPLFQNYQLEVGPAKEKLLAYDGQGKQQWEFSLLEAEVEVPNQLYFSARVFQHYLVVNFGSHFIVLDTLNRDANNRPTLLWKQRLIAGPPSLRDYISIERTGVAPVLREYITRNADREILGRIGTINQDFLCYQLGTDLIAAELLTGKVLWKQPGVVTSSRHFGDADRVIVMTPIARSDTRYHTSETRYGVLSGQSGEEINAFKLGQDESPIFAFERYILTITKQADGGRNLRLKDLTTNQEIWSQILSKSSTYTLGQNYDLVMIQPDGTISFLDLRTGEVKNKVKGQPAANVLNLLVLENQRQYLVFVTLPYIPEKRIPQKRVTFRKFSMTSFLFSGMVYSVDRKSGELMWSLPLKAQGIEFSQFLDLPVITFGIKRIQGSPSSYGTLVDLQVVDLRTGDVVLKETTRSNRLRIWNVPDADRKQILIEPFQIRLSFEEPPVEARKPE
ncbi:outer membrane biogenesis protein BamB [Gimesia alba]|uniref:Outer membrane biogenesis protein BamB n=1 Tax=Gimesia alba TaxID=2527973 RepID=A0A517R9N4_9PLAN|nr:PQQ-binding-like beta-propeller repeat protein [Gimesia alba]QDT40493.1 outer membrane biogenesis protein BamB [Gimesia alba]